jgi:hypothetical protein
MRLLQRRIRQFFAFQAIVPMLALLLCIVHPMHLPPGGSHARLYGITGSYMILALIYGRAWLATRKPRGIFSPWPMAASLILVVVGGCSFWFARPNFAYEASGMIMIVVGLGGLLIYAPKPPRQTATAS